MCTLNGLYNVDVNDFILSNLVDRITMYNKMMYVSPFCDLPNESSQNNGVVLVLHMLQVIRFHTKTAKPSTTAVHIQFNLLEGSKGGEMTSRST